MFASVKLINALNEQVGNEMGASLQYVSIASYLAGQSLPELSRVFFDQAGEEREHAMKFVKFILDVEGTVKIPSVGAPKSDFGSVEEALELSLDAEKDVTQQIYKLVEMARAESSYIALRFLDYFVSEQLEEVTKMKALLSLVRRAGEDRLLYVEDYLARRGVET